MAASDYVPALLKYRLRLEGRPQMESGRTGYRLKSGKSYFGCRTVSQDPELRVRLNGHGSTPFVSIGELLNMSDTVGIDCNQMSKANFKRACWRSPAIEAETKRAVFTDFQHFVGYRGKVADVTRDRPKHVRCDFCQAAIAATVRAPTCLDPISVTEERAKCIAVASGKSLIKSQQQVGRLHDHFPRSLHTAKTTLVGKRWMMHRRTIVGRL